MTRNTATNVFSSIACAAWTERVEKMMSRSHSLRCARAQFEAQTYRARHAAQLRRIVEAEETRS